MKILIKMFISHVISLRDDVKWPLRLPDLSLCNYFLWRYIKAEGYKLQPTTIEELIATYMHLVT